VRRRTISRVFNKQLNARHFELQIIIVRAYPRRDLYLELHAQSGLVKYAEHNVGIRRARRMHYVALWSRDLTNRSYGSPVELGRTGLLLISMHTTSWFARPRRVIGRLSVSPCSISFSSFYRHASILRSSSTAQQFPTSDWWKSYGQIKTFPP